MAIICSRVKKKFGGDCKRVSKTSSKYSGISSTSTSACSVSRKCIRNPGSKHEPAAALVKKSTSQRTRACSTEIESQERPQRFATNSSSAILAECLLGYQSNCEHEMGRNGNLSLKSARASSQLEAVIVVFPMKSRCSFAEFGQMQEDCVDHTFCRTVDKPTFLALTPAAAEPPAPAATAAATHCGTSPRPPPRSGGLAVAGVPGRGLPLRSGRSWP